MKLKKSPPLLFVLLFALSAILISGCASLPEEELLSLEEPEKDFELFPSGADLYISLSRSQSDSFFNRFITFFSLLSGPLDDTQKQIIDKTSRINAAFYKNTNESDTEAKTAETTPRLGERSNEAQKHFIAMLRGKGYPAVKGALGLNLSPDWKKENSNPAFWKSTKNDIRLSIDSTTIFIADIPFLNETNTQIPLAYAEFQKGSAASGWISRTKGMNNFLRNIGLPVNILAKEILFAVHKNGDLYVMSFRIEANNPSVAKAIAGMISIARASLLYQPISGEEDDRETDQEEDGETENGIAGGNAENKTTTNDRQTDDGFLRLVMEIFFANAPKTEENVVLLSTAPMSEELITGFFFSFALP
ncbi:MAG: hypothetical protein LBV68_02010 [Spirochaetaceae bacterium]|jgi:hypothetical protein|nr:hypothetical protein [Spirochaetaceae bacterium]